MDKQDIEIKSTQELSFANLLDDTLQLSHHIDILDDLKMNNH
jgi:hypothetical protein